MRAQTLSSVGKIGKHGPNNSKAVFDSVGPEGSFVRTVALDVMRSERAERGEVALAQ